MFATSKRMVSSRLDFVILELLFCLELRLEEMSSVEVLGIRAPGASGAMGDSRQHLHAYTSLEEIRRSAIGDPSISHHFPNAYLRVG